MSALTGMAISFAWPLALAAIPLALGALVYLFRARGTTQSKVTSSLFLLTKLPQYLPSRRRFVPPLQFWLELALAVTLALAASGLLFTRTGARVAVVIDTSKSMGALLSADETRLQAALRIASADIAQAPADTLFAVLRAARSLSAADGKAGSISHVTKSAAISELKTVQSTYEVDSISNLIAELRARGEHDSIWLYTDRTVEGVRAESRLRVTTVPYDPDVARNIWISSVQIRASSDAGQGAGRDSLVEVGVSRVGRGAEQVSVTATCTDRQSSTTFSLPPVTRQLSGRASSLVQLGPLDSPWSFCRILASGEDDLLPIDNEAWLVHTREHGTLGVFSTLSTQTLGLDRLPFGTPVAMTGSDAARERNLSGVLYHRTAPATLPSIPALVVYPPVGTKLWGGLVQGDAARGTSGSVEITRWDESHPLLQYVRPGLLALPTARVLECPSGARPVLHSAAGALMCAGEDGGRRYVIVGFELFPFDGMRTPTLSIITLNTLQWLLMSSGGSGAQALGSGATGVLDLVAIGRGSDLRVQLIAPRAQQLASGSIRSVEVSAPGVLAVSDGNSTPSEEQLIAVNAISDQESDLTHDTPISIASDGADLPSEAVGSVGYDAGLPKRSARESDRKLRDAEEAYATSRYERMFAWCALAIVVLDLLRRIIGKHGWRERA